MSLSMGHERSTKSCGVRPVATDSIVEMGKAVTDVTQDDATREARFRTIRTSSINHMIHIRGNRADYDEWLQCGCGGWGLGFDSVLPLYFTGFRSLDRAHRCASWYWLWPA